MWYKFDAEYKHNVSETFNIIMARHPGKDIILDQVSNIPLDIDIDFLIKYG